MIWQWYTDAIITFYGFLMLQTWLKDFFKILLLFHSQERPSANFPLNYQIYASRKVMRRNKHCFNGLTIISHGQTYRKCMMADTAKSWYLSLGSEKVNKRQFVIADGAYPREYDITFPERVDGRLEKRDLSTSEKVFWRQMLWQSFEHYFNNTFLILCEKGGNQTRSDLMIPSLINKRIEKLLLPNT